MSKVSVILPVYNAEKYVGEAIRSLLNQTFSAFELLIINDGSTDRTYDVISNFTDPRIRMIQFDENLGLIAALNIGLKNACGEYIIRMDADDICHPDRILRQVQFMEKNVNVTVCGTNRYLIGEKNPKKGKGLKASEVRATSIFNCPLVHPSVCLRKSFLERHGLSYNIDFPHAEDNALWLEILKKKGEIVVLSDRLLGYRKHENQVSEKFRKEQKENSTRARVNFLKEIYGIDLNELEIELYQALSYRESIKAKALWNILPKFLQKLKTAIRSGQFGMDSELFQTILYRRIGTIYLKSTRVGMPLYLHYLKNFFLDRRINIAGRLFVKILIKF